MDSFQLVTIEIVVGWSTNGTLIAKAKPLYSFRFALAIIPKSDHQMKISAMKRSSAEILAKSHVIGTIGRCDNDATKTLQTQFLRFRSQSLDDTDITTSIFEAIIGTSHVRDLSRVNYLLDLIG
jgi:hypothetical protein